MPNDTEAMAAWQDVLSRMMQCFSLYLWKTRMAQIGPQQDPAFITLRNAAIESTLMSVRDIDSFFRPRRREDDIVADDYVGFQNPGPFLSTDEVRGINKKLAHLTYEAVRGGHGCRTWNTADLVNRCTKQFLAWLTFLETLFAGDTAQQSLVRTAISVIRSLQANMNSIAQLELEITG